MHERGTLMGVVSLSHYTVGTSHPPGPSGGTLEVSSLALDEERALRSRNEFSYNWVLLFYVSAEPWISQCPTCPPDKKCTALSPLCIPRAWRPKRQPLRTQLLELPHPAPASPGHTLCSLSATTWGGKVGPSSAHLFRHRLKTLLSMLLEKYCLAI